MVVKLNKKHLEFFKRLCEKFQVDYQTIDFKSLWDSELSYKENKKRIVETIKKLSPLNCVEYNDSEKEHFEQEMTEREEEYFKKEFEKRINEIKDGEIKELEQYFKDYYTHIDTFLDNKKVNGFLIIGKGGIGKTFNLINHLQKRNINFILMRGHFTPLIFYKTLYENREKSYIIIDDVLNIIKNPDIISLLLSALDYNTKLVFWNSKNPLTADLPKEFIFNSKIFILTNEFDENNEFLKALKDRCITYQLNFNKSQIIEMLYIIAKQKNYPIEIVDYIKELSENNIIKNLSLRLIEKLYPYYNKENWKDLIKQIIEINETETLVYNLIRSGRSIKEQIQEFIEKTGLGRTTYFYLKAKILGKNTNGYNY